MKSKVQCLLLPEGLIQLSTHLPLSFVKDIVIRNSYDYVNEDHNKQYPPTKCK